MDFYPRSPCGERLTPARMLSRLLEISIHALLAESDNRGSYHVKRHKNFYPRSPCGERQGHRRCSFCPSNISIHALLAESDRGWGLSPPACTAFLSTLSLRRATPPTWTTGGPMRFLSTLSLRRATLNLYTLCSPRSISIHALLAESDCPSLYANSEVMDFYPRSPCGERLDNSAAIKP